MLGCLILSHSQLRELEARWRELGAPIADHLRPGLDGLALDHAASAAGLRLPDELRRWWGWHDGVEAGSPNAAGWMGPDMPFLSLAESLEEGARLADDAARYKWSWSASWLPVTLRSFGAVIVDCAVPRTAPAPVRPPAWDEPDDAERTRILACSLGEVVGWWLDAIDAGGRIVDAGWWLIDDDRIDPRRSLTGLV